MTGREPPEGAELITLHEAARRSGIPYETLKSAMRGKYRKLDAVLKNVTPDFAVWHTWPEALETYQQQRKQRKAPWKAKQKPS